MRDVRKFLGLANYYRCFVKDFAKVVLPMNQLTRKNKKWKWRDEQQKAFEQLKAVFTTRPVLAAPKIDKEFRVEADTSNFATGGVLSVKCEDKLWQPVVFISKVLCKDLSAKCLKVPLNVRVDKENSLESSFIWSIYLYTILLVCALLFCTFM